MEFVKYIRVSYLNHKYYNYEDASSIIMCILGRFLFSDVGSDISFYKEWLLDNKYNSAGGNITELDRVGNYILLTDACSEEDVPTRAKMTNAQFLKLLVDWEEKVCKLKPKEVTIIYDNDEFVFETKN
ncbi:MAG TPA: hypothetical protein VKR54_04120 [Candidatus Babeliales bacterium]|jgi:hypothetical protein|nr:hypothetical protein [Candidatus Babeliales bacterium]